MSLGQPDVANRGQSQKTQTRYLLLMLSEVYDRRGNCLVNFVFPLFEIVRPFLTMFLFLHVQSRGIHASKSNEKGTIAILLFNFQCVSGNSSKHCRVCATINIAL
jgi:hypothetical protein